MDNQDKFTLRQPHRVRDFRRFFERLKKNFSKSWRAFTRFLKNIYLAVLLTPLHREIVFVDQDDQPSLQLGDFLEVHNTQVEKQMRHLKSRLEEG